MKLGRGGAVCGVRSLRRFELPEMFPLAVDGNPRLPSALSGVPVNTLKPACVVAATVTVPTGIKVVARVRGYFCSSASISFLLISSPDEASVAALGGATGNVTATNMSTTNGEAYHADVRTNTSGQIRAIASVTLSASFTMATYGWIDRRGRDG